MHANLGLLTVVILFTLGEQYQRVLQYRKVGQSCGATNKELYLCGGFMTCNRLTKICECEKGHRKGGFGTYCLRPKGYCDYLNPCGSTQHCNYDRKKCECDNGYEVHYVGSTFCSSIPNGKGVIVGVLVGIAATCIFVLTRKLGMFKRLCSWNKSNQPVPHVDSARDGNTQQNPHQSNAQSFDSNRPITSAESRRQDLEHPPAYDTLFIIPKSNTSSNS